MSGWTCQEVRDAQGEIAGTECHHPTLGTIRSSINQRGRQRWTWIDQRGRHSDEFGTLHEARVFAARHRELKYA